MLKKAIFVLAVLLSASLVQAGASGLIFTTDSQTIAAGASSKVLTVQIQNGTGVNGQLGEIADLLLASSSGEFSASVTKWETANKFTWNSNWKNKNFYYRNNVAGTYTITATLTTRTNPQSWTATQTITVGSGSSGGTDNSGSGDNNATSTSDTSGGNDSGSVTGDSATGGDASVLDSPAELSGGVPAPPVAASAGRKRLAAVGSPVTFLARLSGFAELTGYGPAQIDWSFGDGAAASGRSVWHSYNVPGLYHVVLNVRQGENLAVSRTTVEVFAPAISLVTADYNSFTLVNTGSRETNLARWSVHANNTYFIFPEDTIIAAGARLTVPTSISRLGFGDHESLTLYRPDGQVANVLVARPALLTGNSTSATSSVALVALLQAIVDRRRTIAQSAVAPSPVSLTTVSPVAAAGTAPTSTIVLGEPEKLSWWQKLFR